MADEKLDPDFADLPPVDRAAIESLFGVGLHHAPAGGAGPAIGDGPVTEDQPITGAGPVTGDAFHHPEQDAAGTTWEPDWQPIETYPDGEVVMLDDGDRQLLGRREMGMWMELANGDERAQPDYQPMLWSYAPAQVKYDLM